MIDIDTKRLRQQAIEAKGNEKDWIEVSRSVILKLLDRIDELDSKPLDLDPAKDRWYP